MDKRRKTKMKGKILFGLAILIGVLAIGTIGIKKFVVNKKK